MLSSSAKKKRKAIFVPDDQAFQQLIVSGENKLGKEIDCVQKMEGEKALVLNHYYNENGEGEPKGEEVVEFNYSKISFY